jgi:hypothetical protein
MEILLSWSAVPKTIAIHPVRDIAIRIISDLIIKHMHDNVTNKQTNKQAGRQAGRVTSAFLLPDGVFNRTNA